MAAVFDVLLNNIAPIFAVASVGYALRRWGHLDKQTVSRLTFYAFSPCLIFSALVNSQLSLIELGRLSLFTALTIGAMGVVGWGFGRILRFDRQQTLLLILAAMFTNCGNFGLPLNQLRYGAPGVAAASVYVAVSAIIVYTVGAMLASLGVRDWRTALRGVVRLPIVYAIVAAIMIYMLQIRLPGPLLSAIDIAAAGAVPVMLALLGMQLADITSLANIRVTVAASGVRLLIGPIVGALIALAIGLQGVSRASAILEASLPAAVAPIILTTEFDLQPETMTSIVALSTLLSPLSLVATIWLFDL